MRRFFHWRGVTDCFSVVSAGPLATLFNHVLNGRSEALQVMTATIQEASGGNTRATPASQGQDRGIIKIKKIPHLPEGNPE